MVMSRLVYALLFATVTAVWATAAKADCRLFGTKYAAGASTRDLSGTRIWCNFEGRWQTTPSVQVRPYIGPDGRFRPTILPPRLGSPDWYRYQVNPDLYRKQEAYRLYGLPPAPPR